MTMSVTDVHSENAISKPLNILVFAYVYPPDAGSGTYRTLYFTNHWARRGDHVTVVTVREDSFTKTALVDARLCQEIDTSIRVLRASAKRPLQTALAIRDKLRGGTESPNVAEITRNANNNDHLERAPGRFRRLKDTVTDLLACPDEHIGWVADAVRTAMQAARSTRFDCIYASGGPWSTLLAARRMHRRSGLPLVLDFRDPWVSNPNLASRAPLSRRLQQGMESRCVADASLVVANTDALREDFVGRYPDIDSSRFVTVTNGFEDLPSGHADFGTSCFTLVHAGALYQSRNPLNFLRAVAEIVDLGVIPRGKFRVQLVGGISIADPNVEAALDSAKLRGVVEIMPRVPHDEAVTLQQRASVLLLFQTGFPLQVPRKIFEYLSLAKPILAIAESNGATARMVNDLHAGQVVDDEVGAIREAILALHRNWKTGVSHGPSPEALSHYSNRHLASRLRDAIEALSNAN